MPKTVTTYNLDELKEQFPVAYEKVHGRWIESCCSDSIPWSDEVMDSLKATVDAAGATMHRWSIGAYSQCSMSVSVDDTFYENDEEGEERECQKDAAWFYENVLREHGYTRNDMTEAVEFPGKCPFTGYCADECFLEAAYKALLSGDTLTEALESLADIAGRHMEDDMEQHQSAETMHANWDGLQFTSDGIEV